MRRFLVDVPAGSTLNAGSYKYDFIRIEPVKAMTKEEFETDADGFEPKLGYAVNKETKQSMLLQSVQPEKSARIFAAWSANFSTFQISIFGYRWIWKSILASERCC